MAEAIIVAFPKLHSDGPLGCESYYSPFRTVLISGVEKKVTPSGHIEERLKTLRKKEGVRIYEPKKRKVVATSDFDASAPFSADERLLINQLRFEDIGLEKQAEILQTTFQSRRQWIVHCRPTYEDVTSKFVPLKDFGIHFQKEFTRCCPSALDFFTEWEDVSPIVIDWARTRHNLVAQQMLVEMDAIVRNGEHSIDTVMEYAVHVLPYIFQVPPRKGKRPSNDEVASHFVQLHPASTSMDSVVDLLGKRSIGHPVIIAQLKDTSLMYPGDWWQQSINF